MPATDTFENHSSGLTGPLESAFNIAPSDAADLAFVPRVLMVAQAGDVRVLMKGDSEPVTIPALQPGVMYPLRVVRLYATDTTANGIVGLK